MPDVILIYNCGCVSETCPIKPILVHYETPQEEAKIREIGSLAAPIHQCQAAPYFQAFWGSILRCEGEYVEFMSATDFLTSVNDWAKHHEQEEKAIGDESIPYPEMPTAIRYRLHTESWKHTTVLAEGASE